MRLYIPTTAVPHRCIFFNRLMFSNNIDIVVVVQGQEDEDRLTKWRHFSNNWSFAFHHCPHDEPINRITWIRDWIDRELVCEDEWYAMADDKVYDIERYRSDLWDQDPRESYERWGSNAFRDPVPPKEYGQLMRDIRDQCIKQETIFGGVTCQLNPFYRLSPGRWHERQTIPGPFMVTKKDRDIRWLAFGEDRPWVHKEDVVRTAFVLDKYGSVVSDKWHAPLCPTGKVQDYYGTGTGTAEYRAPFIAKTKKLLSDRFPGLLQFKEGDISMAVRWLRP